ncbi:MAG TPA: hypothetical protein VM008_01995 [Phycisphaerae bacterium]|nr:hypothetical protein [Phycisphaerae bacterium]
MRMSALPADWGVFLSNLMGVKADLPPDQFRNAIEFEWRKSVGDEVRTPPTGNDPVSASKAVNHVPDDRWKLHQASLEYASRHGCTYEQAVNAMTGERPFAHPSRQ